MWNSPHKESDDGKRYRIQDLGAFTLVLDMMLDSTANMEVREHVGETILHSMTKEEFVYSLYEVFDVLTGDIPVPGLSLLAQDASRHGITLDWGIA